MSFFFYTVLMCLVFMLLSFLDVRTTFLFDGLSKSKIQWTAECFETTGVVD